MSLWAYAGSLSQNAAKEVAQTVTRNWDGQKGSDLLRLSASKAQKPSICCMPPASQQTSCLPLFSMQKLHLAPSAVRPVNLSLILDNERSEPQKPASTAQDQPLILLPIWMMDDSQDIATHFKYPHQYTRLQIPNPPTTRDFGLPRKKENFRSQRDAHLYTAFECFCFQARSIPLCPIE